MSSSKPIHPATVHFPIAFLILSYSLTLVSSVTTSALLPQPLSKPLTPYLPTLTLASYYLLVLGLLSAAPAAITGGLELYKMIQKGGLYEADAKTMRPKVQLALLHASLSDMVVGLAGWSWWVRSARGEGLVLQQGAGMAAAGPSMADVAIGVLSLPVLIVTANMGSTLVYNHGVGMSMAKRGKMS